MKEIIFNSKDMEGESIFVDSISVENYYDYKIDFDNVKTIEDVVLILKSLGMTFTISESSMTEDKKDLIEKGILKKVE